MRSSDRRGFKCEWAWGTGAGEGAASARVGLGVLLDGLLRLVLVHLRGLRALRLGRDTDGAHAPRAALRGAAAGANAAEAADALLHREHRLVLVQLRCQLLHHTAHTR